MTNVFGATSTADEVLSGSGRKVRRWLESPSKARLFQKIIAATRELDPAADAIERVFGKPVEDKQQLKPKWSLPDC